MLITPEYVFKDVTHITPEWLAAKGITALVLDIDNTLTADRSQELPEWKMMRLPPSARHTAALCSRYWMLFSRLSSSRLDILI